MTVIVIGQSGQVSSALGEAPGVVTLSRSVIDLERPEEGVKALLDRQPTAIINAAAYTAVDRAEEDAERAQQINGRAPGVLARAAAGAGVPFVHISTDYVFAGMGGQPWQPDDPVDPPNVYGASKLAGEEAVRAAGGAHAILRTSWVFSEVGANFVKTMLRLSDTRSALSIVEDQIGGPTPARAIAEATLIVARALIDAPSKSGTYHFSGAPDVSWKTFAEEIFAQAGRAVDVTGIPTADYPTPARRPLNSRLDCSAITETFGIPRPDWKQALADVLSRLDLNPDRPSS